MDAAAGLDTRGSSSDHVGVFLLTAIATAFGASWIAQAVRAGTRGPLVAGVLLVGATYTAVVAGHHDGPLTAGVAGLALLALAHLAHGELDRTRQLPTEPAAWPWWVTLVLVAACAALDGLVALVSGGGAPRPGSPSTLSLLVGCLVVAGLVTALTALADGVALPARTTSEDDGHEPTL